MNNFRIAVNCKMRNTEKQQALINNGSYFARDNTSNYTEYIYTEAKNLAEAYQFAQTEIEKKNDQSKKRNNELFGFTVNYSMSDDTDSIKDIGTKIINDDFLTFHYSFAISRMIIFEVNFYRCGNSKFMHFSTSAAKFNRPKTDYMQCGQAQDDLLPKGSKARQFFEKWNITHLEHLGEYEFNELLKDIETLKDNYYFITDIDFDKQKSLSMTIPRKYNRFGGNNTEREN